MNRLLLVVTTLLAFLVIGLGAYVRLSDAGLGCPDWPGCYGHYLGIPDETHEQLTAQATYPDRPVETGKAWKEMIHRYFAGTLGLLILVLTIQAWRHRPRRDSLPWLPTLLLGIVGFQAALGMWTVTLLLKPVIVTLHLLGGMTTLAFLVALNLQYRPANAESPLNPWLQGLAAIGLMTVIIQIGLGGWVSSNYAALACSAFPQCNDAPTPLDFSHAFVFQRALGLTASGELLSTATLAAIHWSHRLGAVLVVLVVGSLSFALCRHQENYWQRWGHRLATLLTVQVSLGIANVLLSLPLAIAVLHNLGAAALLATLLGINLRSLARSHHIPNNAIIARAAKVTH